jgi:hypothetical protein
MGTKDIKEDNTGMKAANIFNEKQTLSHFKLFASLLTPSSHIV